MRRFDFERQFLSIESNSNTVNGSIASPGGLHDYPKPLLTIVPRNRPLEPTFIRQRSTPTLTNHSLVGGAVS
jgi:hypothetical protein